MLNVSGKSPARGTAPGAARAHRDAPPTRHDLPPRDTRKETPRRPQYYKQTGSRARRGQAAAALPLTGTRDAGKPLFIWHSSEGFKTVLGLDIRNAKMRIVVIDCPVRAITLPKDQVNELRAIPMRRSVKATIRQFRRFGRANGITKAALRTLARIDAYHCDKEIKS